MTQQTHFLCMQLLLFYTAICLYIIFFIFRISLQLASKFNVSVSKMLQLLGAPPPRSSVDGAEAPPSDATGEPPNLAYHFQQRYAASKFWHIERTNIQIYCTYRHADRNTLHPYVVVKIVTLVSVALIKTNFLTTNRKCRFSFVSLVEKNWLA